MNFCLFSGRLIAIACAAVFFLSYSSMAISIRTVDFNGEGTRDLMIESNLLKIVISEKGGKIISLYNKTIGHEDAKIFYPREGINQLRCEGLFNIKTSPLNSGTNKLSVTQTADLATVTAEISPEIIIDSVNLGKIKFIRRYTVTDNSTCIFVENAFVNETSSEINLMPWMKHLLSRGDKQPADVSFMTEHGAFYSENLIPGRKGKKFSSTNLQYFPASNWTSRTVMPITKVSDTLSTVTRPSDIFKLYSWRKPTEDFMTQEVVFKPICLQPGKSSSFKYALTVTAPLAHVEYCSPLLNISVSPQPTGIAPDTKELKIALAATELIKSVQVRGCLLNLSTGKIESNFDAVINGLAQDCIKSFNVPVKLSANTNYQLQIELYEDGRIINPGAAVGDIGGIVIPLVVGTQDTSAIVFKDRSNRDDLFKKIPARTICAPLVFDNELISAYQQPPGERCFKQDTFKRSAASAMMLKGAANEYESVQLILTPKTSAETDFEVESSSFSGPGPVVPQCESVNSFLYAATSMPSCFNAAYPVGEYPEALLPVKKITLNGQKNYPLFITYFIPRECSPGIYSGEIKLKTKDQVFKVPVAIKVWNFVLPQAPLMTVSADMKEIPKNVVILDKNGRQLTTEEIHSRLVDMHLKYKITPSGLAKKELFSLDADKFEEKMRRYLEMGATMVFLGTTPDIIKALGEDKIRKVEAILKAKKMFGHFYVRLAMDEASEDKVPEIRKRCEEWKKNSSIPIMETYYYESPQALYGLINIYARSFSNASWIKERMLQGDQFWKGNAIPTWLEPAPWLGRRTYWEFFEYNYSGTYIWTIKNWRDILDWGNDWWSDNGGANLASALIWHHPSGLLSTIRLESFRNGVEDNTMLHMLRQKCAELTADKNLPADLKNKMKDAENMLESIKVRNINSDSALENMRNTAGELLSDINTLNAKR